MKSHWRIGVFVVLQLVFAAVFSPVALGNGLAAVEPPVIIVNSGDFTSVDLDQDGNPDHLVLSLPVEAKIAGEYWISAELQTEVNGEWQTLNYTATSFDWSPGRQVGEILFYGGEFVRRSVEGPCRVVINLRTGVWESKIPHLQDVPEIHSVSWQASDIAATDGPVNTASEALRRVQRWAKSNDKDLGHLLEKSFAFDRWRMDFTGTEQQPPRRIWVDPYGDISAVDRRR